MIDHLASAGMLSIGCAVGLAISAVVDRARAVAVKEPNCHLCGFKLNPIEAPPLAPDVPAGAAYVCNRAYHHPRIYFGPIADGKPIPEPEL